MTWIAEHLDLLVSLVTVIVASFASIAGITVKMRSDKKALEIENVKLAQKSKDLEKAIVEGSYIVCPQCGHHIFLKDVEIKTKGVAE